MFVRSHHHVPSIAPLHSTDDNINKSSLSSSSDSDGSSSKSLREGEGNSSSSFSPHHEVVISGFSTLKNKRLMKNKDDANTNTTTTSSSEKPAVTLTIEDLKTKFKKHEVCFGL